MYCLEIPVHIRTKALSRLWMPFLLRRGHRGARVAIFAHQFGVPHPPPFATPDEQGLIPNEPGSPLSIMGFPHNNVDLIISAGGNTSFINAALAVWLGCDNIFIGSPRRLSSDMFTAHLTLERVGENNNIVMDLPPTLIDPVKLRQKAPIEKKELGVLKGRPVYALIIGGDGAGFQYERNDWVYFVSVMKKHRDQDRAQWLLTTSRRTTRKNDALIKEILRATLPEDSVLERVIWSDTPRKVMQAYLSAADRIFVTADSMSMISECISTEKPVTLLHPKHASPDKRYQAAIEKFIRLGFCSWDKRHEADWQETGNMVPENKAKIQDIRSNLLSRLETRIESLRFFH